MPSTSFTADPAAELLFGKGRRELLALLFGQPEQRFYLRELARITGASAGTTQRELRALEGVGLVRTERRGNQVHYQANRASPLFDALRTLLERTMGAADLLRAALAPLADRLEFAGIYGSVARGTPGPGSDIDVLVVGDVEFAEVTDAIAPAEKRLGRPVNPSVYSSVEFARRRGENRHFIAAVLGAALIPLIGDVPSVPRRVARQPVAGSDSGIRRGSRPAARSRRPRPR